MNIGDKIDQYFNKMGLSKEDKESLSREGELFNLKAIFSIFDTNYDGKISKEEFDKISRSDYENFVGELKNYNASRGKSDANENIWTYGQLQGYLNSVCGNEEAYIISEDEASFDCIGTSLIKTLEKLSPEQQKFYYEKYNNSETTSLKDISQMTKDEIIAELQEYGIPTEDKGLSTLSIELQNARNKRATYDKGSDIVDGKIGTYMQGDNKLCTVLAQLTNMTEQEIQELYGEAGKTPEPKVDENGEKYWEIQFPQDKGTNIKIKITEKELKSGQITFTENDEERTFGGIFPQGDADVTLLSMAFVKRFGTSILRVGAWSMQTKTKFSQEKYMDNQHLELLDDYSKLEHEQLAILSPDEIKRKGIECKSLLGEDLSYVPERHRRIAQISEGRITTLSDGRKACICKNGIFLSDGTVIQPGHAMAVSRYDADKKELIIIGNEFGNLSEIRVPEELLVYFECASLEGTAGVKETPQPELTD